MTFQSGGTLDRLLVMSRRKRQQEGGSVFIFVLNICEPDLVDVVQFEVFQKQQQDGRDGLHDDLLVSIDVDAEFHALEHGGPASVNQNHLDFILMRSSFTSFTVSFYLTILIFPIYHNNQNVPTLRYCPRFRTQRRTGGELTASPLAAHLQGC